MMKQFLRETNQFFSDYMPPVTRRLFYVLVLNFLFMTVLYAIFGEARMNLATGFYEPTFVRRLFVLTPSQAIFQGNVWQFFTYMLSHASFGHLLGNVLGLFFFGGLVENQMGGRRYLWFVIIAGGAAGLAHTGLAFALGGANTGLIGFSGSVFAILTAAVIWFPRMRVLVMFLFPMPLRVLAAIFGFFMAMSIFEQVSAGGLMGGGVSEVAHVTGVLVGIILVKNPGLLDFFEYLRVPGLMRRRPQVVRSSKKARGTKNHRISMGHPGRHTDPDDLYDDPHWKLDQ